MSQVIAQLRDLVPIRPLSITESLRIAELQATRFRHLAGVTTAAFPESGISERPRVQVDRMFPAPSAGASQWSRGRWLILLNGADTKGRQRFSLAHEFKHILDHPFIAVLYPPVRGQTAEQRAEAICDYFAACLLMPRVELKRLWAEGNQDIRSLARRFDVSFQAMQVRLIQLGLIERTPRHLVTGAHS